MSQIDHKWRRFPARKAPSEHGKAHVDTGSRQNEHLPPMLPILRSSTAMCDGPNGDYRLLLSIDDSKRESPQQETSGVVLSYRPAFRGFADRVGGSMQFFDEVCSCFGAASLVPGDRVLDIRNRALVILKTLSVHLPWPAARDGVLPTERSPLCPLSNLRFCGRLLCPKPLAQTHPHPRDCPAGCWLMQRARQRRGRAPVSEDRKSLDSWHYSTPRDFAYHLRLWHSCRLSANLDINPLCSLE